MTAPGCIYLFIYGYCFGKHTASRDSCFGEKKNVQKCWENRTGQPRCCEKLNFWEAILSKKKMRSNFKIKAFNVTKLASVSRVFVCLFFFTVVFIRLLLCTSPVPLFTTINDFMFDATVTSLSTGSRNTCYSIFLTGFFLLESSGNCECAVRM